MNNEEMEITDQPQFMKILWNFPDGEFFKATSLKRPTTNRKQDLTGQK